MTGFERIIYARTGEVIFLNGIPVLYAKKGLKYSFKFAIEMRKNGFDIFMPKIKGEYPFEYLLMPPSDFVRAFDSPSFSRFRDYIPVAEEISKKIRKQISLDVLVDTVTTPVKKNAKRIIVKNVFYGLLAKEVLSQKFPVSLKIDTTDIVINSDPLLKIMREKVEKENSIRSNYDLANLRYSPFKVAVYSLENLDKNIFGGEIIADKYNSVNLDLFSERYLKGAESFVLRSKEDVKAFVSMGDIYADTLIYMFVDRRSSWKKRDKYVRLKYMELFAEYIRSTGMTPAKITQFVIRPQHPQPSSSA